MPLFIDARLPVWLDGAERSGAAYLVEGEAPAPPGAAAARFTAESAHPAGCACCVSRSGAAVALGALFVGRARGGPAFGCVVVRAGPEGRDAVRHAVANDQMSQARYRLG